jgi:hypothetical protein
MRNSIIIIAFAFIAIFTTTNVAAQNGKTSVSVSTGQFFQSSLTGTSSTSFFSTSTTQRTSQFTPMLSVKLERQLGKYFSIGLNYNKLSASTQETTNTSGFFLIFPINSTTTQQNIDSKMSGFALNLKGIVYSNDLFQAYVGTAFGGLAVTETIDKTVVKGNNTVEQIQNDAIEHNVTTLVELNVGARVFVSKNVGFYGEIGTTNVYGLGGASGQVGVLCRF